MADRMTVIADLGALLADAVQRGDDRASVALRGALELIVADAAVVAKDEVRRAKDRERPPRNPRTSKKSMEIHGIRGTPQGFPTPLPNSPTTDTTTTPRAREADDLTEMLLGQVAGLMGDLWCDVDGFLQRREYRTWAGWLKEITTQLTASALPADIAQVCRDDSALDRILGSPKGFRIFVADAIEQRKHPRGAAIGVTEAGRPARNGGSSGAARREPAAPNGANSRGEAGLTLARIKALAQSAQHPGQGVRRSIPRADVEKLGPLVLVAYDAIGGASRVLEATGEQWGFLTRDFAAALEAAGRQA